jgi:transposase
MAAYSIDLRQNILYAYARRLGSQRALAHVFGVSLSFVEKVLRRSRSTGELGPKPPAGGQTPRLDAAAQALVRQRVDAHPDATLEALCTHVADTAGVRVSLATMCRLVQRLGLPRKKLTSGHGAGYAPHPAGAGGLPATEGHDGCAPPAVRGCIGWQSRHDAIMWPGSAWHPGHR